MANCVTCGEELHPERAEKYDYCTRLVQEGAGSSGLVADAAGPHSRTAAGPLRSFLGSVTPTPPVERGPAEPRAHLSIHGAEAGRGREEARSEPVARHADTSRGHKPR